MREDRHNTEPDELDTLQVYGRIVGALSCAESAHRGLYRADGLTPHFYHLWRVACAVQGCGGDEVEVCAALLHDAFEDTDASATDINCACSLEQGGNGDEFSYEVLRIINALTRREGETYRDYIDRVSCSGQSAILIKVFDIEDNSHPTREGGCPESLLKKRYIPALEKLGPLLNQ